MIQKLAYLLGKISSSISTFSFYVITKLMNGKDDNPSKFSFGCVFQHHFARAIGNTIPTAAHAFGRVKPPSTGQLQSAFV